MNWGTLGEVTAEARPPLRKSEADAMHPHQRLIAAAKHYLESAPLAPFQIKTWAEYYGVPEADLRAMVELLGRREDNRPAWWEGRRAEEEGA